MSFQNIRRIEGIYEPAAVGSTETVALFQVKRGDRVLALHVERQILAAASTTSTIEIGDGTDVDGFVAAIDTESGAVGGLVEGAGAFMANSGGKLYTADDTVDAVYTIGATPGAVKPRIKYTALVAQAGA